MTTETRTITITEERLALLRRIQAVYKKAFVCHRFLVTNNDCIECIDGSAEFGFTEAILQVLDVLPADEQERILSLLDQRAAKMTKISS